MMCPSFRRGVPLSFSDSMGLEKSVTERKRGKERERERCLSNIAPRGKRQVRRQQQRRRRRPDGGPKVAL